MHPTLNYHLATALIAASLYALWARSGRPLGVEQVERHIDDE